MRISEDIFEKKEMDKKAKHLKSIKESIIVNVLQWIL